MGKKRGIAVTMALILVLGGVVWIGLPPQEPMYRGKTLSAWLREYSPMGDADNEPADEAVRSIGTNAVPTLLRMLRAKDSKLKTTLIRASQKQHVLALNLSRADELNFAGVRGFAALSVAGSNAVPKLVKIYKEDNSDSSREDTAYALGSIGPAAVEAIPALLQGTASTNYRVRAAAVAAVAEIHGQPDLAVPALLNLLQDSAPIVELNACVALRNYGTNAKTAIPELIILANTAADPVHSYATNALEKIDPEAAMRMRIR